MSSTKSKCVLVTGACGLTGSHLVARLVEEGYSVVAMDLMPDDRLMPEGVEFEQADVTNPEAIDGLFSRHDIDAVCHLAAIVPYNLSWSGNKELLTRVNVVGSERLMMKAIENGVRCFVHASSSGVAFRGSHDVEESVEGPALEGELNDAYSGSKALAERAVLNLADPAFTAAVALRPNGIWGAGGETHHTPKVLAMAQMGLSWAAVGSRGITDFTHVANLCEAFVLALRALEGRLSRTTREEVCGLALNVTDGQQMPTMAMFSPLLGELGFFAPFSYKVVNQHSREDVTAHFFDLSRELTREEERHCVVRIGRPWVEVPHWLVWAGAWACEAGCSAVHFLSFGTVRWEPFLSMADARKLWFHNSFSSSRARDLLGWKPVVSPAVGLREAVRFYRGLGFTGTTAWPALGPAVAVVLGLVLLTVMAFNVGGALQWTTQAVLGWGEGGRTDLAVPLPALGLVCHAQVQPALGALLLAAVLMHALEALCAAVVAWHAGLLVPFWAGSVLVFGFPAVLTMAGVARYRVPTVMLLPVAVVFIGLCLGCVARVASCL